MANVTALVKKKLRSYNKVGIQVKSNKALIFDHMEDKMSSMTIIDGVAQLLQEVQQKIDDNTLYLSTEEWARLDRSLEDVRPLLAKPRVSANELEDAAWLVIATFEHNVVLAKEFADRLAVLTGGTKLTGRVLRNPQSHSGLVKNRMTILTFAKRVKKQAQTSRQSEQSGQTGRTGQRS